jgi:hypothetical protein
MTCPVIDACGRDGTGASVALATERSGRPLATRTPTVGAGIVVGDWGVRSKIEVSGARVGNASGGVGTDSDVKT